MKTDAVVITAPGGPETLELGTTEVPEPGPEEVRVAVTAAGLNRADCLQRRGVYPAPPGVPADVPGLEYAGVVEKVGVRAGLAVGDRVMGIVAGGGMAKHLNVHARETMPVPAGLSLEQAAAIPEVFLTAYDALVQGGIRPGSHVLIHAAGSGVGTAAIQLVKALGAVSIGTSRTPEKLERCKELGLHHTVLVGEEGFADAVKALGGADLVLDTIGAKYLKDNIRSLRKQGTIVTVGLLGGVKAELNLGALLAKRGHIIGSVLRSRPIEEKIELAQRFGREMLPFFEREALRPIVDSVLPMAEIAEAHQRMEASETFGKIVMKWS